MRWLIVTPELPSPPNSGGRLRIRRMVEYLLTRGHTVTLLSLVEASEVTGVTELSSLSIRVVPVLMSTPPLLRQRLLNLAVLFNRRWPHYRYVIDGNQFARALAEINDGRYDIVQIEHSFAWALFAEHLQDAAPQRVLDLHNVECVMLNTMGGDVARKLYRRMLSRVVRSAEGRAVREANVVLAVSREDAQLVSTLYGVHPAIVPNGADIPEVDEQSVIGRPVAGEFILTFVGKMDYEPNVDGIRWFVNSIWPHVRQRIPRARLAIVGRSPTAAILALRKLPGVYVTGTVPSVDRFLRATNVVICPLRGGGGTKLKVLEAMAYGLPVISTPEGVRGLDVIDGHHVFIARSEQEFVEHICACHSQPDRARRVGKAARELVARQYAWDVILKHWEQLVTEAWRVTMDGSRGVPTTRRFVGSLS